MFNVGGGEFLVIMLIALIVLGPAKLPEAARQIGSMARELRRISSGFQNELKTAFDEPTESEARQRGRRVVSSEESPAPAADLASDEGAETTATDTSAPEAEPEAPKSTAEAAGMYDIAPDTTETEPIETDPIETEPIDTDPAATEPADTDAANHGDTS